MDYLEKLCVTALLLLTISFSFAQQNDYKKLLSLSYAEIDSLVMIPYQKGDFKACLLYMQAGRDKAKTEFGEQDSVFANYIGNVGFFYNQIGEYEQALPLYIRSMNIREKVLGELHPEFATSLNNLASLQRNMGNYDQALPLFIRSKDIRMKMLGEQHEDFAASLNNLANLYESMGNYDQALPLYIQSMHILKKVYGELHPNYATSLNNLAGLYESKRRYEEALPLYIQSMNILETASGELHPDYASSLNNLAGLYKSMGNYNQALPLYIQSKNIRAKGLGQQHPDFASSLNNLAGLYKSMGNYNQALPLYIESMDIRKKTLGVLHLDFAESLNNLANLHRFMGNNALAWPLLLQAIEVNSTLKVSSNIRQAWADSLLVAPYPSNAHLKTMLNSLQQLYALVQNDISIVDAQNKSLILADLALLLLAKLRNQVSNEQDKLRLLEKSSSWLKQSLGLLNRQKEAKKAFQLSDQNKSVLLLQATKSEQAYRLGELPESLVWEDKKLFKKQSQLQAKLLEKRLEEEKDSLRNELNHVNQDLDLLASRIKKEFPKYYKLKYQQIDVKVDEIQNLLDTKTALLEYVVADSMLHIFYVDKTQVKWVQKAIGNTMLSANIKGLHYVLSNYLLLAKKEGQSYRTYTELAYWFYQNLIEPAQIDAALIKNLIIVSDGELGHLPFEAFLMERAPQLQTDYAKLHYMVNDFNISYNYSATLWKENMEIPAPKNNGQILALAANYEINLDGYRDSLQNTRLPTDQQLREVLKPLPAARKEVEALQEKFNGFFAFDKDANEKLLKEKAPDFAIIHLAMHGILDSKRPVLSSLACSENNDSTENNFWQAHEISKMKLNANLVVLSACETGYGKFEQGNGIASLARAFMYAGSSALIVSLWQVNDYATAELMKNLYNNLADGMKKDEALRQAKLQYMATAKGILAHPAFWSPFIMMGNTEVMMVSRKGDSSGWIIGGGILTLLAAGFGWRQRKK